MAVWGVASPVVAGRPFTATVGVKCAAGCRLSGMRVVVRDAAGAAAGEGRLGEGPSPGTRALYASDVSLVAPDDEGVHAWTAAFTGGTLDGGDEAARSPAGSETGGRPEGEDPRAPAAAQGASPRPPRSGEDPRAPVAAQGANPRPPRSGEDPQAPAAAQGASSRPPRSGEDLRAPVAAPEDAHAPSSATFSFRTAGPPDHRVTVTVRERDTEAPIARAEVRVGLYRGATGADGRVALDVAAGEHAVSVRKAGYQPHADRVAVTTDVVLRVDADRAPDPDLDDDHVWM